MRFGARVSYRLSGKENTVTIVGHDEADPAQNLLSFLAPLSRALLGAEVGEAVDFGGKEAVLEVLAIE